MGLPRRDAYSHAYRDYLEWPENVRHELIDGAAYIVPQPNRLHQEYVGGLYMQIKNALLDSRTPARAYIAPFDVRLPKSNESDDRVDTVVQPDVLVICDPSKLDDRGARGAPDWVVEVLSPATASHDQTTKLAAYERARVPEVWFVHPTDRTVIVYRHDGTRYTRPAILEMSGELAVGVLPQVKIDWARLDR